MSSPKAAAAKTARRPAAAAQVAAKRVPAPPAAKPAKAPDGASADAKRLAAEIERALAGGQRDLLSDEALQALMAAVAYDMFASEVQMTKSAPNGTAPAAAMGS